MKRSGRSGGRTSPQDTPHHLRLQSSCCPPAEAYTHYLDNHAHECCMLMQILEGYAAMQAYTSKKAQVTPHTHVPRTTRIHLSLIHISQGIVR